MWTDVRINPRYMLAVLCTEGRVLGPFAISDDLHATLHPLEEHSSFLDSAFASWTIYSYGCRLPCRSTARNEKQGLHF